MKKRKVRVVVATRKENFAVFAGELIRRRGERVILQDARMCACWGPDIRGVPDLAVHGPDSDCQVTPRVSRLEIEGVILILDMTSEAVLRWEAEPWKN